MSEKEKLLKLAELVSDVTDQMVVMKLQIMILENAIKKSKEAKKKNQVAKK